MGTSKGHRTVSLVFVSIYTLARIYGVDEDELNSIRSYEAYIGQLIDSAERRRQTGA